jgi:hypothetical protein
VSAPALPRTATWTPKIVWGTGTSTDTSAYDDVSQFYQNDPGLQVDGIGRDQVRAYSPPKAPTFDLTLTNYDGRFSPGGPLALFLGRGPAVTLDAAWGADYIGDSSAVIGDDRRALGDGTSTIRMFTGTAHDMASAISRGQRTVAVTAIGGMSALVATFPTTILYENIRTDEAVAVLLDAVGWPTGKRSLGTGSTTLLYWFLNGQTSCKDALDALLATEGAGSCAYEDGGTAGDDGTPFGTFHFEGREFRDNNPRSTTVQWAFFDGYQTANAIGDSAEVLGDALNTFGDGQVDNALLHILPADYTSNPDEVVVSVAATINTRVPGALPEKVWEYGGPLVLGSSEVRDVKVTASDPFKDAIVPRDGTDYTIASGSPLVGISLLTTSGQTVTLRLTAPGGGCTINGVTSNGIQVRATSLPVASQQTVTSTVNTALAAARQGSPNNPLVLQCWPEIEANQTLDLCNSMALRYQKERRQITFRFANIDAIHQYAAFDIRPSDRVQFVHTHAQLNVLLWVETVHYTIAPGGGFLTVELGCEQVFDLTGGKFDSAVFDSDVFGV